MEPKATILPMGNGRMSRLEEDVRRKADKEDVQELRKDVREYRREAGEQLNEVQKDINRVGGEVQTVHQCLDRSKVETKDFVRAMFTQEKSSRRRDLVIALSALGLLLTAAGIVFPIVI